MQVTTICLDIAKNLFQARGADAQGRPVLKRKLARGKVLEFFATLPPCLPGTHAAGDRSAHRPPHRRQAMVPAPDLLDDALDGLGRQRRLAGLPGLIPASVTPDFTFLK